MGDGNPSPRDTHPGGGFRHHHHHSQQQPRQQQQPPQQQQQHSSHSQQPALSSHAPQHPPFPPHQGSHHWSYSSGHHPPQYPQHPPHFHHPHHQQQQPPPPSFPRHHHHHHQHLHHRQQPYRPHQQPPRGRAPANQNTREKRLSEHIPQLPDLKSIPDELWQFFRERLALVRYPDPGLIVAHLRRLMPATAGEPGTPELLRSVLSDGIQRQDPEVVDPARPDPDSGAPFNNPCGARYQLVLSDSDWRVLFAEYSDAQILFCLVRLFLDGHRFGRPVGDDGQTEDGWSRAAPAINPDTGARVELHSPADDELVRLTFPYKHLSYSAGDCAQLFTNLSRFYLSPSTFKHPKGHRAPRWDVRYRSDAMCVVYMPMPSFKDGPQDRCFYVIGDSHYHVIDILPDLFTEPVRLRASRRKFGSTAAVTSSHCPNESREALDGEIFSPSVHATWYGVADESNQAADPTGRSRSHVTAALYRCVSIAVQFYKQFKATRILDISAGWGDRMIAALACAPTVRTYVACDPNRTLIEGHSLIRQSFSRYLEEKPPQDQEPGQFAPHAADFRVVYGPFESSDLKLAPGQRFDLAFSSPPYFNFEKYTFDQTQSWVKHGSSSDSWLVRFLLRSYSRCWSLLEDGGHLAIYIQDVSDEPICEPMSMFVLAHLPNSSARGVYSILGGVGKSRPVWVWQKQAPGTSPFAAEGRLQFPTGSFAPVKPGDLSIPFVPWSSGAEPTFDERVSRLLSLADRRRIDDEFDVHYPIARRLLFLGGSDATDTTVPPPDVVAFSGRTQAMHLSEGWFDGGFDIAPLHEASAELRADAAILFQQAGLRAAELSENYPVASVRANLGSEAFRALEDPPQMQDLFPAASGDSKTSRSSADAHDPAVDFVCDYLRAGQAAIVAGQPGPGGEDPADGRWWVATARSTGFAVGLLRARRVPAAGAAGAPAADVPGNEAPAEMWLVSDFAVARAWDTDYAAISYALLREFVRSVAPADGTAGAWPLVRFRFWPWMRIRGAPDSELSEPQHYQSPNALVEAQRKFSTLLLECMAPGASSEGFDAGLLSRMCDSVLEHAKALWTTSRGRSSGLDIKFPARRGAVAAKRTMRFR
ncbi:hypothetical protein H696_00159 [Fonticula alba]|uniref:Uncharacterized protein n=1 Tax=Fonticula alba TaxID=691883 RepID=A0A058ZF55_FONAL|nr:hypothetical protein H696_00159 [Fonticula alba]KCV72568.1 hypothetical protein H696_00159 [Fonticula alba]|eukprot:XP_009492269.1 hypothetical protein H696_00159 [Fonticula alba]